MAEMSSRYKYVKGLADSAAERAKGFHLDFQMHKANAETLRRLGLEDRAKLRDEKAASCLNDFFYWIGHSNAYRGIALQVDFMETVEMDEDEEPSCP